MALSLPTRRRGALPSPTPGTVDVWHVDLGLVDDGVAELLSAPERARAARIVRERQRELWVRSRGTLRRLLGCCLDRDPRALRFEQGAHGKPRLRVGPSSRAGGAPDLRFNLSHSGELMLAAVAAGREVGVDVECARDWAGGHFDELAIAARMLGPEQVGRLAAVEGRRRSDEFLRAWTLHEAGVKCLGTGLGSAAIPDGDDPLGGLWRTELDVGPRTFAAVAVEGGVCELHRWDAALTLTP